MKNRRFLSWEEQMKKQIKEDLWMVLVCKQRQDRRWCNRSDCRIYRWWCGFLTQSVFILVFHRCFYLYPEDTLSVVNGFGGIGVAIFLFATIFWLRNCTPRSNLCWLEMLVLIYCEIQSHVGLIALDYFGAANKSQLVNSEFLSLWKRTNLLNVVVRFVE